MAIFLGLDVGTQGVKALLLDPSAGVVAKTSAPLTTLPDLPIGWSEQRPEDWIDAIRQACGRLRDAAPGAMSRVVAVGVSGQQHGLVALDEADRVLRPAMLWNDVRCARECAEILDAVGGPSRAFELAGLASLPPGFTAGKLRWVWRHEPKTFAKMRRVLLPHDFVNLWLSGTAVCENGDASGTGWLDVRTRRFSPALCDATAPGTMELLPPLAAPGDVIGTVRAEVARELGIGEGTAVSHGAGDNMAAAIGAGATGAGLAVLSLGTSGTVFAHADAPVCDPDGEIAPFCGSGGGWLPLGCTMNATVATEAARSLLGLDIDGFEERVSRVPAGAEGVLCLPFLTGERSPDLPDATGALLGLTPRNLAPENVARAAMEGATFALCRLLDRLRGLDVPIDELRLTGGGSNSPTWCRVVAAVSGVRVRNGVEPDSAALGAAVLAAWAWRRDRGEGDLGVATCRDALALDSRLQDVVADESSGDVYARRRSAWQRAVDALSPAFPDLRP